MVNTIKDDFSLKFKEKTGQEFNSFYTTHRQKLVWYLNNYTKDNDKSEDFADEAFILSLQKIDSYNNEKSQIHTWIYKIAENLVKRDFKEQKKIPMLSLDKNNSFNDDECVNLIKFVPCDNTEKEIEEKLILEHKAAIVTNLIDTLPDKYKQIIILREIEKKSYIEIAELTRKNYIIDSNNEIEEFEYPEEFWNITLNNKGSNPFNIKIVLDDNTIFLNEVVNNDFKLSRDSVKETFNTKKFKYIILNSKGTKVSGTYIVTTNLSTIKSQIVKGRKLIQNKSKKLFKQIDTNGIKLIDNIC